MNANDELRRLLDERGIKWWPMHDIEAGYYQDRDTEFVIDGKKYTAHEWGGKLTVYGLTPAQAIAATLGESMTDTEKEALCARIDELCQEVERLRKAKDTMRGDAFEIGAILTKARDENTKLRELVVTLMACVSVDDCDKCPINGAEFKVSEVRCCRAAKQRMRELGIEVD